LADAIDGRRDAGERVRETTMADTPRRLQVAVIGLGRLGTACALALLDDTELALAGIVRRPNAPGHAPGRLQRAPVVGHVRELATVDAAFVCVPAQEATDVTLALLQGRLPVVECAALEGAALARHHEKLDDAARRHRVSAVVGAGWNPGAWSAFVGAFERLIPRGQTVQQRHPATALHHSPAAAAVDGVRAALEAEIGGTRYVYVELAHDSSLDTVRERIASDPLFVGVPTQVFTVDDVSGLEDREHEGVVLERLATAAAGQHASLLLEARFDLHDFAARAMLDAARQVAGLPHGAHRYTLRS
jgi:diaminopimelate dehydrogenase